MVRIAGVKMIKNATGKVTHVTLSVRHHKEYPEDMLDGFEMAKAVKGNLYPGRMLKKGLKKNLGLVRNRTQKSK